jgi:uncharacterized membrane protein
MMAVLFEFLFKYRLPLYQKGVLGLRPLWPPYVISLVAAGVILFSCWSYRRTAGVLPVWKRIALTGLRAASLLTLMIPFFRPVLILHSVIPQQSFVAVAYDVSKSMEIRDGRAGQSRLDVERNLLRTARNLLVDGLEKKFRIRWFRFSGAAERTTGLEDPPRHGNMTDLGRVLEQIVGELEGVPLSGIVLVSDGADNRSQDLDSAVAVLRARHVPIYCVGIGSSDPFGDVEVVRVMAPRRVLKGAMVEASVEMRAYGYAGRRTRLTVRDGSRILQSREVVLGGDGEADVCRLEFAAGPTGPRVFSIRAEPLPEEIVSENNGQDILLSVIDEQPLILYVEGEPRWLHGFLRRAVLGDSNLHLVTLLRQADGKYLRQGVDSAAMLERGFPAGRPDLFRYKALLIGDVESSFFTFDQLNMISDYVSLRGGGFLMMGGKHSFGQGGYIDTPLEDVLPVSLRRGPGNAAVPEFQNVEFTVRLTPYGMEHPATRMSSDEAENRRRWNTLPPLVGINTTGSAKPGAIVLAHAIFQGARLEPRVLLAVQRFGRGKSAALVTPSIWRWRMELDRRDNFHELFWRQMLRWLVADAPDPLEVETERQSYSPEDPVVLRAEIRDSQFEHLNNAQVTARVKSPSGQTAVSALTWEVGKEGNYSAVLRPREAGIYETDAEAFVGGKSLGTAKAYFRIAESADEFRGAALRAGLLRQLAADTGGRYYPADRVINLPEDISHTDTGATRLEERELWDMPFLFAALVAFLTAEWVLRKREGLA